MRSLRSEVLMLAMALSLPLAIALVFPYRAIGFRSSCAPESVSAFAAFVTLPEGVEERAVQAVKVAWQGGGSSRTVRADLSVGELPEQAPGPVLGSPEADLSAPEAKIPVSLPPAPPSAGAGAPVKIPQDVSAGAVREAFPREELLKID